MIWPRCFLRDVWNFVWRAAPPVLSFRKNWLFLTSYKKFREKLIKNDTWHLIARLGPGAFETISGEVVKAILVSMSHGNPAKELGGLFGEDNDGNLIRGVDVSEPRTAAKKAAHLLTSEVKSVEQSKQLENPDAIIKLDEHLGIGFVRDYAGCFQGLTTGDDPRLKRHFWEFSNLHNTSVRWVKLQGPSQNKGIFAGRENLVDLRIANGELRTGALRGREAWGKVGVAIDRVASLSPAIYYGDYYHSLIPVLIPKNENDLPALFAFATSEELRSSARKSNQSLSIDNGYFEKFEFDIDYWKKSASEKYPNNLPKPHSDDPTQWIFHGHSCGSVIWNDETKWTAHGPLRTDETVLQVAVARLLGYLWPTELDASMELADEQHEWVKHCDVLLPYADKDGIVCIPPVRGETSAADRLHNLLAAAYGDAWSNNTLTELLKNAGHAGKTLETWLREKFFTQHCKLFKHRPFIWHIWDGLRDGFAALVNYHKLDQKNLETLIYTYLGDWISRQKQDITTGVDGAEEKLAAAEGLKKRLELILEGESPYDIFIRWKPIEKQPMGWDADLNDGVRLNIRPFMTVPNVGKKGAGVLRDKPNIKWNKDRGKDVASAPWYHLFKGDRINDHHLTLEEKNKVRNSNR